jgi:hypothetical protein
MLWLQNEHEPNHALQVMFLKDLPLRRCPGEYWDLPVCLVRVGHSNQRKREVDEEAVSHLSSLHGSIRRFRHEGGLPFSGSIAGSVCTRTQGVWISDQARHLFDYTKSIGGKIAATEFMNEPTYATMGGAPKGYDTMPQAMAATLWCSAPSFETLHAIHYFLVRVQLVRDRSRCQWVAACSNPKTCYMRPATYSMFFLPSLCGCFATVRKRGGIITNNRGSGTFSDWLSRPEKIGAFYTNLRDRFEPGKSLWITETADAACGGNPWASTFLDTFRYLVQHASLAQRGVKVIMHNTLASSDYGLLDQNTFAPRPNYWAALLWRRLMVRQFSIHRYHRPRMFTSMPTAFRTIPAASLFWSSTPTGSKSMKLHCRPMQNATR